MTRTHLGAAFVVMTSVFIFIHGWYYKPMIYATGFIALLPWPGIIALAAAGLGTILAIARRNSFSKASTFGLLLLLSIADAAGFALARDATMTRSHFFGPEAGWESLEILLQTAALGLGCVVLSTPLVFVLVRQRPVTLKILRPRIKTSKR